MNIRIQTCILALCAIAISSIALTSAALCMPRLIFKVPPVKFVLSPDVDGDGQPGTLDLLLIGRSFGATSRSVDWNPKADLTEDGIIDIFDVVKISTIIMALS